MITTVVCIHAVITETPFSIVADVAKPVTVIGEGTTAITEVAF
jgi:hypothetical protein